MAVETGVSMPLSDVEWKAMESRLVQFLGVQVLPWCDLWRLVYTSADDATPMCASVNEGFSVLLCPVATSK